MGQSQSKDELLHQQVSYGNVEGIKALHSQGAGLEVSYQTILANLCVYAHLIYLRVGFFFVYRVFLIAFIF